MATTTSAKDSGLLAVLIPEFTKATGIGVRVVAVGSGQAFEIARRGDADVVIAHDAGQEAAFMQDGFGSRRIPLMYNDFVVIGPSGDPARAKGKPATEALSRISAAHAPFVSRGDKSGTHSAELRLWKAANINIEDAKGTWYKSVGTGMGATLNFASGMNGYTLSDRATWLGFKNKGDLVILSEGSADLRNFYSVLTISAKKHPHLKLAEADKFADWLVSKEGQRQIADFKVNGTQVFFPNAGQ